MVMESEEDAKNMKKQLNRLNIVPSAENWEAMVSFFNKKKLLERLEKTAELANKAAASSTPF